MTDPKEFSDADLLTHQEVTAFLEEKAIVSGCLSCTQSDWTLQFARLDKNPDLVFATNTIGIGVPFQASVGKPVHNLPWGRPVLPLICNNCGFMKIHDYEVVRKWVLERRAAEPSR